MEVLNLELLDSLAQHPIHFPHVYQLVVNLVNAARLALLRFCGRRSQLLSRGAARVCLRRLRLLRLVVEILAEFTVLCVTHSDLSLRLLRQHRFKVRRVCFENTLDELQSFPQLLVLHVKLGIFSILAVIVSFDFLNILSKLSVRL